ncbi:hypothetical protein JD844_027469 [Phrynosoma platyrhinos]|uniref:Translocator protein n=1 Tax=Phrynosoma platyrhinos TaxID=52577 RepID=A0ABQ7SGE2_PHRPL|nr:hypothetical protein JD844_027469 [Phrynosoma platyrhinos]
MQEAFGERGLYGSYLVWKELGGFNEKSMVPLGLYAGNLVLNWSWVPIFFGKHKIGWVSVTVEQISAEILVLSARMGWNIYWATLQNGMFKVADFNSAFCPGFQLILPINLLILSQGLVSILLTTGAATATTTVWYHVNKTAAYLLYPYLAWLTFASVLNYRIWKDNPSKKQK